MKYVKSFEDFVNEKNDEEIEVDFKKDTWKDSKDRGYINFIDYGKDHPDYPNGLVVFNGSYVDKDFRGQGIFTELLNGFLETIPKKTTIQVPVQNKNLRNLFIKLNFKRVKRIEYWGLLSAPNWNFEKIQD
jgi:ribosomal protein S18 acetylase RimI-like enzyme